MSVRSSIVIVDGFSTGAKLAPNFRAAGFRLIHVQSASEIPADFAESFVPANFDALLTWRGELQFLMEEVEAVAGNTPPQLVLPGTESGVELAERLACAWALPTNDPATASARRNKYEMATCLERAGLPHAHSCLAAKIEEIYAWRAQRAEWPVVLKPVDSAGNDSVFFCSNDEEVRRAFHVIIDNRNRLGLRNTAVLAQQLLRGAQYVVNVVSIDGRHYVSDMWEDRRQIRASASTVYDREYLLASEGELQTHLQGYAVRVLDALGIRNGPSHSEIMFTDTGPVLIETAARMQGALLEEPLLAAIGSSQVSLTLERYLQPDVFRSRLGTGYRKSCEVMCVALIAEHGGIVSDLRGLEHIRSLASFHGMFHLPKLGERISRTVDIFTIPGVIYLVHQDKAAIDSDYETLRALEREGALFGLV